MSSRMALTDIAQEAWKTFLRPGSSALDATAGNGLDTLFIARTVGPGGHVFSIDIQETAVASTGSALSCSGLRDRVDLRQGDHSHIRELFPSLTAGQLDLVCFNLGYLPGGDHSITTTRTTTLAALESSLGLLSVQGALSVIAYRGHPGAKEEYDATAAFFGDLPSPWCCLRQVETGSEKRPGPVWWLAASSG